MTEVIPNESAIVAPLIEHPKRQAIMRCTFVLHCFTLTYSVFIISTVFLHIHCEDLGIPSSLIKSKSYRNNDNFNFHI